MNAFDRFCAVLAGILAVPLLILGVIGVFAGSSAHFSLPPILGVAPAFFGWGILRSVMIAWNVPSTQPVSVESPQTPPAFNGWPNENGPDSEA